MSDLKAIRRREREERGIDQAVEEAIEQGREAHDHEA